MTTTILVHGWSDTAKSFTDLKAFLHANNIADVREILFGEYESREDALTFDDIVDGLHERLIEHGIIGADGTAKRQINVIVHSTGGLVIRHWIWRYYLRDGNRIADCPIRRLVMLAPANFGSPLAHRGKSFLGSIVKGRWEFGNFLETGRTLLDGLELASPYQWQLAERDTLGDANHFSPDGIQLTVLTGVEPYKGIPGMVTKPGTDGTIVIAGAPLNAVLLRVTPTHYGDDADAPPYRWSGHSHAHDFAFGVLEGLNHTTIKSRFDARRVQPTELEQLVLRALRTRDADSFRRLQQDVRAVTDRTYQNVAYPQYQQFLVRVRDDHDVPVRDFTLSFGIVKLSRLDSAGWRTSTRDSAEERRFGEAAHKALVAEGHENRSNAAYRRFLVDPQAVKKIIKDAAQALDQDVALTMRVYVPPVDGGIRYENDKLHAVALATSAPHRRRSTPQLLFPNTTTLVDIGVDRKCDYVWLSDKPVRR
ncbi:MAG: hypothetical protein KF689_13020 [Gemmatimonadaceae bacterium]|nr:hypothetical protein [Gemmatimonadaceae bacterium]MCW5827094.1 hypothetical protein [Gemmatimonadaceae bacterium]